MRNNIKNSIEKALKNLQLEAKDIVVEHPADPKMGDYSTSVAMSLAKKLKSNPARNATHNVAGGPKVLAEQIVEELRKDLPSDVEKVEVAGAGFINFHLNKYFFQDKVQNILENKNFGINDSFSGKEIMIEYTDPNPFKPFHIGHLMTNSIGESLSRILEQSGAKVSRANYQGDVGLHVARAIWGLMQDKKLQNNLLELSLQSENIGKAYAKGSELYESDEKVKAEIDEINKKIYKREDEKINAIYDWGFKVTMEAFENLYKILGTKFDFYFLESQVASLGEKLVRENTGKIFKESDGAVVFKGEEHDSKLHTRVFITSAGLPTYETKELGLTVEKFKTKPNLDLSIVVTANEQMDYMRVVAKAISLISPEYGKKMLHITHGMMRFASGKMSSRKGNIVTGESLIRDTIALAEEKMEEREWESSKKKEIAEAVGVAAIKYSILKQSTGGDIIFDFDKSISFEGDSGPYLQYSYARAKSIVEKAAKENIVPNFDNLPTETSALEKLIYQFPEVVLRSAEEFQPHFIANFLIELSRAFNTFYGSTQIIDAKDVTSPYKVALTSAFSQVLKTGLHLLGIEAPEKM